MTDREIADMCSYPHYIFHYVDSGIAISSDPGGNNFFGDEENYISQLKKYKLKFGG